MVSEVKRVIRNRDSVGKVGSPPAGLEICILI